MIANRPIGFHGGISLTTLIVFEPQPAEVSERVSPLGKPGRIEQRHGLTLPTPDLDNNVMERKSTYCGVDWWDNGRIHIHPRP